MKFNKEANKIFKITRNHLAGIEDNIVNFKNFCKEIVDDNYPSPESQCYYQFYQDGSTMINIIHNSIKDMLFKFQQKYSDKERVSVLYPYEKQAIWQYLKKPNAQASCYRPFGCIYAEKILIDNKPKVVIGISVCNDNDIFYKNIALNLARTRAREYPKTYNIRVSPMYSSFERKIRVPSRNAYESAITNFIKRCAKWFEAEEIIYPNNIIFNEFPTKKEKKKFDKITNKEIPF